MKRMTPEEVEHHNKEVASMFDDIQPFTITIASGKDAAWLSSAMILWLVGGDDELGRKTIITLVKSAIAYGTEKGVDEFFKVGREEGHEFPEFLKPVMIHMIDHLLKNKGKTNEPDK